MKKKAKKGRVNFKRVIQRIDIPSIFIHVENPAVL